MSTDLLYATVQLISQYKSFKSIFCDVYIVYEWAKGSQEETGQNKTGLSTAETRQFKKLFILTSLLKQLSYKIATPTYKYSLWR